MLIAIEVELEVSGSLELRLVGRSQTAKPSTRRATGGLVPSVSPVFLHSRSCFLTRCSIPVASRCLPGPFAAHPKSSRLSPPFSSGSLAFRRGVVPVFRLAGRIAGLLLVFVGRFGAQGALLLDGILLHGILRWRRQGKRGTGRWR